jgi:Cu-Zn family superoxide dismutase
MRNPIQLTSMVLVTVLFALPGCKSDEAEQRRAIAELRNADGQSVGKATFEEVAGGVEIHFEGKNLPPGSHGFHIHDTGDCDAPSFTSAGDHFNPTGAEHGFMNPKGHHMGDLPNLQVRPDGTADVVVVVKGATLAESGEESLVDGDGTALVVHTKEDDQLTDPSGDSGARIACGVIKRRWAT